MNTIRRTLPMYQEMNSLLENFFNPQREDASFIETSTWSPLVDIKEENDRFVVLADIPGVKKEDIDISLEQHVLTLKGERHFEKSEERNGYTRRERAQGQFYRRLVCHKPQMIQKSPHVMHMEYWKFQFLKKKQLLRKK